VGVGEGARRKGVGMSFEKIDSGVEVGGRAVGVEGRESF
jgi:hypothetical protein